VPRFEHTAAGYQRSFEEADTRRLDRVRNLRRQARGDSQLSEITRAVLGATGSAGAPSILERWIQLYEKAEDYAGTPLVVVENNGRQGSLRAYAGIISGSAVVEFSSDWDAPDKKSAGARLNVPVEPMVSCSTNHVWRPEDFHHYPPGALTVARVNLLEFRNDTNDPNKDFSSSFDDTSFGRREIYRHERFQDGISEMLLVLGEIGAGSPGV
jgi:hypothetical protein